MSRRATTAYAALLVLLCALGIFAYRLAFRDRSLETVLDAGVIRIGYAVEAPHAFIAPGGEVTGLSPELARRIALRLGARQVEWRLAEFHALLAELEEGRIDVVAAGMFITPERARRAAFSEPIFHVRQALLVARGNPLGLHSYQDAAASPAARIAVLSGSVEQRMLTALGMPAARLVQVADAQTGQAAVASGEADGLALSSPTLQWMVKSGAAGRATLAKPFVQPPPGLAGRGGYGAFVLRKGDAALLDAWNKAQARVLSSQDYPRLMELFGFSAEEYPGGMTAREAAGL